MREEFRRVFSFPWKSQIIPIVAVGFGFLQDDQFNELLRQAIEEMRNFRIMYAAIWIPLFTMLLVLSYINYRLYKRQSGEETTQQGEETRIRLRKDLHDAVVRKDEDVEGYVNRVVEESLKKGRSASSSEA